ncbi:hypothetical protein HAZT_HAZT001968 [Hyalella azteca]|uniref:Uncharacterized protein n=1 Tax=Hyalella azteca TaxID=294128 RepID=A0A6A0HDH3_HYAAZ|nr:hypothetical protein HAZT_HAZT001968 [Hyalella azteca]
MVELLSPTPRLSLLRTKVEEDPHLDQITILVATKEYLEALLHHLLEAKEGSTLPTSDQFGGNVQGTTPFTGYGGSSVDPPANTYGTPDNSPSPNYGPPNSTPAGEYGPPVTTPSGGYDAPSSPSSKYGAPNLPSDTYGPPVTPSGEYGAPSTPSGEYGAPSPPSGEYGAPSTPSTDYGTPTGTTVSSYETPGSTAIAFGNNQAQDLIRGRDSLHPDLGDDISSYDSRSITFTNPNSTTTDHASILWVFYSIWSSLSHLPNYTVHSSWGAGKPPKEISFGSHGVAIDHFPGNPVDSIDFQASLVHPQVPHSATFLGVSDFIDRAAYEDANRAPKTRKRKKGRNKRRKPRRFIEEEYLL